MRPSFRALLLLLLMTVAVRHTRAQNPGDEGKAIFSARCAACHAIGKQVVGPDLKGVDERRQETWIINFVQGSQKMVQAKDSIAVGLFEQFNHTVMPDHPDLSSQDIRHIIAYIHNQGAELEKTAAAGGAVKELYRLPYPNSKDGWLHHAIFLDLKGHFTPLTSHDYLSWIMIFTTVLFLVAAMVILVKVVDLKQKAASRQNGPSAKQHKAVK